MDFCPLASDGEADFHPVPGFGKGGLDGELLVGEGVAEAGESFEVEEDFSGVEVGVLVSEEGEIAAVGFGGDGDVPLAVEVVVFEVVEGKLGGFFFEALAEDAIDGEVGGVGGVAEGVIVLGGEGLHGLLGHGEGEPCAEESFILIESPGLDEGLGVFPWEVGGAHGPESVGHEHAAFGGFEVVGDAVHFPTLGKHFADVGGVAADDVLPVGDVVFVTGEAGHFFEDFGDLELVHGEAADAFAEEFGEVVLVAIVEEVEVAGVLINLPRADDVLGGFDSVGAAVPGGAFVIREHAEAVGEFAEAVVFGEVFPGEDVAVSVVGFVGGPGSDFDLEGGIVAVEAEEVIYGGLGVVFHFPALADLDGIHEVEGPEVVVDIDELLIGAAEVGDFVVELPVHFGGFGGEVGLGVLDDVAGGSEGGFLIVVHGPRDGGALGVAGEGEGVVLSSAVVCPGVDGGGEITGSAEGGGHALVDAGADALGGVGIGSGFDGAAFGDEEGVLWFVMSEGGGGGDAVSVEEGVAGELEGDGLGGGDEGGGGVIGGDELFLGDGDAGELVFADEFIGPPFHADGLGVGVGYAIDDDAAVEDAGVFVELPAVVVVSGAGVLGAGELAFEESDATGAEVVVKGVGEANGFVLDELPTGVVAADVVGEVSSEKAVLTALDFLRELLAVVGEGWLLGGGSGEGEMQENESDDDEGHQGRDTMDGGGVLSQ